MKIAVMMCLWKRYDLERIALEYYNYLAGEYPIDVYVAGSEGEKSRKITAGLDSVKYFEIENDYVSRKHRRLLKEIHKSGQKYHGVIVLGSDDFIAPDYIGRYFDLDNTPDYYYQLRGLHYLRTKDNKLSFYHTKNMGAGRFLPSKALDDINWTLWTEDRNRGLDGLMTIDFRKAGVWPEYVEPRKELMLVDVKHTTNISSSFIVDAGEMRPLTDLDVFPEWVVGKLLSLNPRRPR
jgi:hypothetical protein